MPPLETEEEAEKRMSKRAKSSSESDKERIDKRKKDAYDKKVSQLRGKLSLPSESGKEEEEFTSESD